MSGAAASPPARAAFDRVHTRDAAGDRGKPRGGLVKLTCRFGAGIHCLLGAPEDGTIALVDVLAGTRAPLHGRVEVAGFRPDRTAAVRARIGSLGERPRLPPAVNVREAVRLAMQARGESGDRFDAVLDPFGLTPLHARKVSSLGYAEARAVELALALTTPAPLLIALFEPFAEAAIPRTELVHRRLQDLGAAGVCVVVATSSATDARALGGQTLLLERGALTRRERPEAVGLGVGIELCAWVRPGRAPEASSQGTEGGPVPPAGGVREVAVALALRPEVQAVSWEEVPFSGVAELRVRGLDPDACALALTEALLASGVAIETIVPVSPALAAIRSATVMRLQQRALLPRGGTS